jgi:hypothetical protein
MRINLLFKQKVDDKQFIALEITGKKKTQHAVSLMTRDEIKKLEQDLRDTAQELQRIYIASA